MKRLMMILIPIFLISAVAFAGNEVGNGTDSVPFGRDSAWFLGKGKVVRVCYELDPDFGAQKPTIEESIQKAYSTWDEYLNKKQERAWNPGDPTEELHLATAIELMTACDGSEDLKIYFGTEDKNIRKLKKKYVHPVAFSAKTKENLEGGWSRGLIWVNLGKNYWADGHDIQWSNQNNIIGILLHEVGHILGCDHADHTIMDSGRLLRLLSDTEESSKRMLTQIDGKLELYICRNCGFKLAGKLGYRPNDQEAEAKDRNFLFQLFSGSAPKGEVIASVSAADFEDRYMLTVKDSGSNAMFVQMLTMDESPYHNPYLNKIGYTLENREGFAFRKARSKKSCQQKCSAAPIGGIITYGTIRTPKNEIVPVVIERNINHWFIQGPLTVKFLYQGKVYNLFTAVVEE